MKHTSNSVIWPLGGNAVREKQLTGYSWKPLKRSSWVVLPMAKYSSADLLKDEMNWIGSKDFIGKMINRINKSSTVLLTIQVPKNVFLRAAVLCDDIQELSELKFEQNDLINL